jgi:hypothetical protein
MKMRQHRQIDLEKARELVDYDPATGVFRWKVSHGRAKAGSVAGSPHSEGYTKIVVGGVGYYAHRLAWAFNHDTQINGEIDHINGNRSDNRLANLRVVPPIGNARNRCRHPRNTSGVCGVSWNKKSQKWYAYIIKNTKQISLGFYSVFSEAVAARDKAAETLGFDPLHGKPHKHRLARPLG